MGGTYKVSQVYTHEHTYLKSHVLSGPFVIQVLVLLVVFVVLVSRRGQYNDILLGRKEYEQDRQSLKIDSGTKRRIKIIW